MKKDLKNYLFGMVFFVVAIGGAALFVSHQLIAWYKVSALGEMYSFFSFLHPDPLVNLAPMFQDILRGNFQISDGRTFESLGAPNQWSMLAPIIAAPLIFILRNISLTFLFGEFFAALGVFFIVYILAKKIIGDRLFSLLFASIFISATLMWGFLFPISLENLKIIAHAVFHIGGFTTDTLMSRYVSLSIFPAWPFFSFAFLAIFLALKTEKRLWILFAGFTVGLLPYLVLTDALYLGAGLGVMAFIFLLQGNYRIVKAIGWIFCVALSVSVFYWQNFLTIRALPWATEFYRRLGGEFTHAPRLSFWKEYIAYGTMMMLVWRWGKRYEKRVEATYIISFIFAAIVVLNIQLITGFNPQPTAWYVHQTYFGLALGWLILFFWMYDFFSKKGKTAKHFVIFVFAAFTVLIVSRAVQTENYIANYSYTHQYIPKQLARSFDWLNTNTPVDSVVLSPSLVTNALVPVWTHNRVLAPVAITSTLSQNEILDRFYVLYKIFNVDSRYLRLALLQKVGGSDDFALQEENALPVWLYDTYFFSTDLDAFFRGRETRVPPSVIEEVVTNYKRYPSRSTYLLGKYKMDYLYVGPYERRISDQNFDADKFLEKVYDSEGVSIYKIKN